MTVTVTVAVIVTVFYAFHAFYAWAREGLRYRCPLIVGPALGCWVEEGWDSLFIFLSRYVAKTNTLCVILQRFDHVAPDFWREAKKKIPGFLIHHFTVWRLT